MERVLVQNLPSGPYNGAAFYQQNNTQGLRYLEMASHNDKLFVAIFDRLCRASSDYPDDYGSDRHRRAQFERLRNSPVFQKKGRKVRMRRWYHIFDACDEQDEEYMPHMLLFILFIGIKDGYWKSVSESPIGALLPPGPTPAVSAWAEPVEGAAASSSSAAPAVPAAKAAPKAAPSRR